MDGDALGGDPTGPKSTLDEEPCRPVNLTGCEGVETGMALDLGDETDSGRFAELVVVCMSGCEAAGSSLASFSSESSGDLGGSKVAKSASFHAGAVSAGAGAAFDIARGGREPSGKTRVGAVEPVSKPVRLVAALERVALLPPPAGFCTLPFSALPAPSFSFWPFVVLAASCAAFLFRRSMLMLCPGRTCARAHLCPNLQLPLTNQAHTSFCRPGSSAWCEKGQDAPAVHDPTLKNLQGTWDKSLTSESVCV